MSDRTKDRLLYALKSRGPNTAATLAKHLGVTAVAVRQHLDVLLEASLVEFEDLRGTVGRPRRTWRISETGNSKFPDNHSGVLVDLLGNIKDLYGEEGLQRLIDARADQSRQSYLAVMKPAKSLSEKLKCLAEQRSEEGYMAEVLEDGAESFLFAENHCSICAAAVTCQHFCKAELNLFQEVLGDDVQVERLEHILNGDRRCLYKVSQCK
ncbi:metalloregulator ArsR/SmtB family transcription factor [Pseudovibrio sp. Tun.PSC04-5.I4]|uniref:helix-turn-helix transcriptional regulator n=1 Tax=Pseudovibrio sp. Tun.PSC04-5.I4 TaxID=1798213 RepID=UPI00088A18E3|nr:metalloregulator ArsR/SmtB family transcription factor [Pseudovibrio sp. Tun.PSC04-5.I4]SDR35426.1 Predicted transcriptional regulator, ArsR family [Pseudovibrio sp. Tun.PSC04-5.I4]